MSFFFHTPSTLSEQESFERWETKLHLAHAHFAIETVPGCDPFPAARRHVGCGTRGIAIATPLPHINANSSIFDPLSTVCVLWLVDT